MRIPVLVLGLVLRDHHVGDNHVGDNTDILFEGSVVQVKVAVGDEVKKGDTLLILGAMKMEHTISAPADATVLAVNFAEGDMVAGERKY